MTATKWYDGYHFGNADVYCPWDVINYVKKLSVDPEAQPQAYWINTSGNELVRRFIDKADKTTQNEIERMVTLIRGLFGQALKTNDYLYFAVLTGCLRVSKESIFTGLNNFDVNSIVDVQHDEQFGFTEREVACLLKAYGLEKAANDIKEWYDGYQMV